MFAIQRGINQYLWLHQQKEVPEKVSVASYPSPYILPLEEGGAKGGAEESVHG
jgi:hypothetical protein